MRARGVIRFRRLLYGETLAQWEEIKYLVDEIQLDNQNKDAMRSTLGNSGAFKVRDLYLQLRLLRFIHIGSSGKLKCH
jgi:hypothetical protein